MTVNLSLINALLILKAQEDKHLAQLASMLDLDPFNPEIMAQQYESDRIYELKIDELLRTYSSEEAVTAHSLYLYGRSLVDLKGNQPLSFSEYLSSSPNGEPESALKCFSVTDYKFIKQALNQALETLDTK